MAFRGLGDRISFFLFLRILYPIIPYFLGEGGVDFSSLVFMFFFKKNISIVLSISLFFFVFGRFAFYFSPRAYDFIILGRDISWVEGFPIVFLFLLLGL